MTIQPLAKYIIIEPIEESAITKSGIVLPNPLTVKQSIGTVYAPGNEVENLLIAVGAKVLFRWDATTSIEFNGKRYLVGKEEDIIAVIQ